MISERVCSRLLIFDSRLEFIHASPLSRTSSCRVVRDRTSVATTVAVSCHLLEALMSCIIYSSTFLTVLPTVSQTTTNICRFVVVLANGLEYIPDVYTYIRTHYICAHVVILAYVFLVNLRNHSMVGSVVGNTEGSWKRDGDTAGCPSREYLGILDTHRVRQDLPRVNILVHSICPAAAAAAAACVTKTIWTWLCMLTSDPVWRLTNEKSGRTGHR